MRKKELETAAQAAALKALESGNPYKISATVFYIGHEARYIYAGEVFTAAALDMEYLKTAAKDFINGYRDRAAGYYDKWYRYTRADEGRGYDMGVKEALKEEKTPAEMHIIPCIH